MYKYIRVQINIIKKDQIFRRINNVNLKKAVRINTYIYTIYKTYIYTWFVHIVTHNINKKLKTKSNK